MINGASVSNNDYRLYWSSEPIVTKSDDMVNVSDTILTHTGHSTAVTHANVGG